MKRVYEKRTWNFRGEQYEYEHIAWLCEDSGEQALMMKAIRLDLFR